MFSLLLLTVLVVLAGTSPVLGRDGAFIVLTPTEGCPGTEVTLTLFLAGPLPNDFHLSSNPIGLFEEVICRGQANGETTVTCTLTILQSACLGHNTITASVSEGQIVESVSASFEVPSTCPGVRSCAAVGGCVEPVNKLSVLSPWLAVIGLVGCIGTVVVVAKKRQP